MNAEDKIQVSRVAPMLISKKQDFIYALYVLLVLLGVEDLLIGENEWHLK